MAWRIVYAIESIDNTTILIYFAFLAMACMMVYFLVSRRGSFENFGRSLFEE